MPGSTIVQAIYLTLAHSLWQGAVAALMAAVVIAATKSSSSALRYNLLLACTGLFFLLSACTFVISLSYPVPVIEEIVTSPGMIPHPAVKAILPALLESLSRFLNAHSSIIVSVWFIILVIRSVSLGAGLSNIRKLKKENAISAGPEWNKKMAELCERLEIKKYAVLLQSPAVRIPLTAGFLKPVVLIPAGLLMSLPASQVEAILLHELAHIKRNDYLVNLFQCVLEVMFFFNPAVWWLSSLIRAERENCCDDLAVNSGTSKINYVKALISFEEIHTMLPVPASALTGMRSSVLIRVKRILSNRNKTLHVMEKTILTATIVVTGILTIAFTGFERNRPNRKAFSAFQAPSSLIAPSQIAQSTDTVPAENNAHDRLSSRQEQDSMVPYSKYKRDMADLKERMRSELTKEQKDALEQAMAEAKMQADEARRAVMNLKDEAKSSRMSARDLSELKSQLDIADAKINTEEIRREMEKTGQMMSRAKLAEMMADVTANLKSANVQRVFERMAEQLRDVQSQLQKEQLYGEDMENAKRALNNGELKKQMDDLQLQMQKAFRQIENERQKPDKRSRREKRNNNNNASSKNRDDSGNTDNSDN